MPIAISKPFTRCSFSGKSDGQHGYGQGGSDRLDDSGVLVGTSVRIGSGGRPGSNVLFERAIQAARRT